MALGHRQRRARELAAQAIRLNLEHDPVLVPLETLAGRNHHPFGPREEPALARALPLSGLSALLLFAA